MFLKGKHVFVFLFLLVLPNCIGNQLLEPSNVPRFVIFTLVMLFSFAVILTKQKQIIFPNKILFALFIAFYSINILSCAWALNIADCVYESQKIFLAIACIIYFLNCCLSSEDEQQLVKAILITTLFFAIFGLIRIIQLPSLNSKTIYLVRSFSEHRNLFASLLMLFLCFSIYGILFLQNYWKWFSIFITALILFLIYILQVRSVYLAVTTSLFLFFGFQLVNSNLFKRYKFFHVSTFILFILVSIYLFLKLNEKAAYMDATSEERLKIWAKTALLIKDNLWLGVGAGNWQYNFLKYGINDVYIIYHHNTSFQRPHNDFLWLFSETGIIGFVLVISIISFISFKGIPQFLKKINIKGLLFFSFLIGLLVDSFFSFPKERITHIVFAALLLALLIKHLNTMYVPSKKIQNTLLGFFIATLLLGLIIGYYRFKGEYYTQILIQQKERNQAQQVIENGKKALSYFYNCDPTSTPIYSYLGWAYNAIGDIKNATSVSEQAYQISPFDYEVLCNYGYLLGRNGNTIKAKKMLEEALRINLSYEPSLVNMAILEFNLKNYESALKWLKQVDGYESKYNFYYQKMKEKLPD